MRLRENISAQHAFFCSLARILAMMLRSFPVIASDRSPGRRIIDRLRSRMAGSDIVGHGKNVGKKSRPVMARLSMPESVVDSSWTLLAGAFRAPESMRDT
jgi:hypothetical protein